MSSRVKDMLHYPSPFLRLIESLFEHVLPRRSVEVTPKMSHLLDANVISDNFFLQKQDQALLFRLDVPKDLYIGGFFYIETCLTNYNGDRQASLIVKKEFSASLSENILSSNLGGTIRELIFLEPFQEVYWQPSAKCGLFSVEPLRISKVSSLEAFLRVFFRNVFDCFRGFGARPSGWRSWFDFDALKSIYKLNTVARVNRVAGIEYEYWFKRYTQLKREMIFPTPEFQLEPADKKVFLVLFDFSEMCSFLAQVNSLRSQSFLGWVGVCLISEQDFKLHYDDLVVIQDIQFELYSDFKSRISAINQVLKLSNCEWFCCLTKGATLTCFALRELFCSIKNISDAKIFYGDSDVLENGQLKYRLKPDWSEFMFLGVDFIGDATFFSIKAVLSVGGVSSAHRGADFYELTLRVVKFYGGDSVVHVSDILLHEFRNETYVGRVDNYLSMRKAILDHVKNTALVVEGDIPCTAKLTWVSQTPSVLIVIPNKDKFEILSACINSIFNKTLYNNYHIVIVDNQSSDLEVLNYYQELRSNSKVSVSHFNEEFNFSKICNFGASESDSDVIVFLNNDTEVLSAGWLCDLVSWVSLKQVGAVGAKLLYSNLLVQHVGITVGIGGIAGHTDKYIRNLDEGYLLRAKIPHEVTAVTGACLAIKRTDFIKVNGFNEDLAVAYNDVDLCLKLTAIGLKNIINPYVLLYHHESISRGKARSSAKRKLEKYESRYMKRTWGDALKKDRYHNANLSYLYENYSLRRIE